VTKPEFRQGVAPPNKGLKLPAEVLTPGEVAALMDQFGSSVTDTRNRALVRLLYYPGLKMGQVLALQRRHYDDDAERITIPATKRFPETSERIDTTSKELLDKWLVARKRLGARPSVPLFCTFSGSIFGPMYASNVRGFLGKKARDAGIDKRVTAEGLRLSGRTHRLQRGHLEGRIEEYIEEDRFRSRYPGPYDRWSSALDLFALNPTRHATRIGHDCREALLLFANALLEACGGDSSQAGTVTKIRQAVALVGPGSRAVQAQLDALVIYWTTVSDLAQRQEHGAGREGESLTIEDARRLVFQTMLVMYELDRAVARTRLMANDA
jgi:hypothetical protein